ncbi:uncharacterized protein LOC110892715 [Helianthus annuus]|nr:uncharacterized protein LOC110892715 [Helianthus annuus]
MHLFSNRLDEGCVYRLHRFVVKAYNTGYRPLRRDCHVEFTRNTSISPSIVQPCSFRRYIFELTPFNVLRSRAYNDTYLTDVIGVLREWGYVDNGWNMCNHVTGNGKDLTVSLWGKLALKYRDEDMRRHAANTIVIVLTSCKVRLFEGAPCLTSTVSSHLYINLPLPICDVFKNMLPVPVLFKSNVQMKKDFHVNSVSDVYRYLREEEVPEGTMYNIAATIVDIDFTDDWKYIRCSTCRKKTQFVDAAYYCLACKKDVANPRQAYKLVVRVLDNGVEMTCVLFDDVAVALLDITAEELVIRSLSEGVDDPFWAQYYLLDTLCARSVIFRIKVDRYNAPPHCSQRFTASKYIGENVTSVAEDNITSTIGTSTHPIEETTEDIEADDAAFISRITTDEWEMAEEALWGPRVSSVSTITTISSAIVSTDDELNSATSTREVNTDDASIPTKSTNERVAADSHERLRPRKSLRKPKKFTS